MVKILQSGSCNFVFVSSPFHLVDLWVYVCKRLLLQVQTYRLEKAPGRCSIFHHSQACVQGDCNNNLPVVAAGSKP